MKAFRALLSGLFIVTAIAVTLSACKKDKEPDTDTSVFSDYHFAEAQFEDVSTLADEASYTSGHLTNYRPMTSQSTLSLCATVTHDSLVQSNADTITIDFGAVNCTCTDGRSRRGKVLVTYTGSYRDSLTTIVITFDNYFVDDNGITGTKTIVNRGRNAAGHLVYTSTATGAIVLANGAGTISLNSNKTREWTSGQATQQWNDDIYSITGNASGTATNGNTFTANVTSPLIRNMALACRRHFVQGTLELAPAGKAVRTVDYGNGNCDATATVTINGNTYTIQLR